MPIPLPINQLRQAQRLWATTAQIPVDTQDCTPSAAQNLFLPPQAHHSALFATRNHETPRHASAPPNPDAARLLTSTAALVHNYFAYWQSLLPPPPLLHGAPVAPTAALEQALEVGPLQNIRFAESLSTGRQGAPQQFSLLLDTQSPSPNPLLPDCKPLAGNLTAANLLAGSLIAVQATFLEPYRLPRFRPPFAPGFFPYQKPLWSTHGLPGCQALAEALFNGFAKFRYLNAGLLLRQLLTLARTHAPNSPQPRPWRLLYLWFDCNSPHARRAADELDSFRTGLGADGLYFQALSFQALLARLHQAAHQLSPEANPHARYLAYLQARYGGAGAAEPIPPLRKKAAAGQ